MKSRLMHNPLVILNSFAALLLCLIPGQLVEAFLLDPSIRRPLANPLPLTPLEMTSSQPAIRPKYASCRRKVIVREATNSRRDFFGVVASKMTATTMISAIASSPPPALAASPSIAIFSDKNFSIDDAKSRFQAARKDLKYLVENYSEITKSGGGDAVRNYLGTQGVNSNLYGIQKVLKLLTEESEDIVEYSEAMEEFNAYYFQAEGAAYQSLFAEHSSAKATPESCLATAKQDIVQMQKYMEQLAQQLNL